MRVSGARLDRARPCRCRCIVRRCLAGRLGGSLDEAYKVAILATFQTLLALPLVGAWGLAGLGLRVDLLVELLLAPVEVQRLLGRTVGPVGAFSRSSASAFALPARRFGDRAVN
jgi:hypothetical protein